MRGLLGDLRRGVRLSPATATGGTTAPPPPPVPPPVTYSTLASAGSRETAIESILADERFADLTIRCIDEKSGRTLKDFKVNRTFLASASELWRTKLYSRLPEYGKGCVIQLPGADPSVVECIVRYCYFVDPKVSVSNALPVRLLCEKLQVNGLKMVCDELLSDKSMTPSNVCEMLAAALSYDLKSLVISCIRAVEDKFRVSDFRVMFDSESFKKMPVAALRELLKSDRLKIKEEKLFARVVVWANTQASIRERQLLVKKEVMGEEKKEEETKEEGIVGVGAIGSSDPIASAMFPESEVLSDLELAELHKKREAEARTAQDFMRLIKAQIRFPVMEMSYFLTEVSKTKLLTVAEEHSVMKSVVLETKLCSFEMAKRKGAFAFADAFHFTRGTGHSSWAYSGSRDALAITMNRNCYLLGVGLWLPEAGCRCTLRIYRGTNRDGETAEVECEEETFPRPTDRGTPTPYLIGEEPFLLEKDALFTVEIHQINTGGGYSYETRSPLRTITHEGITMNISAAARSPNSTGVSGGGLPVFYICPE